MACNRLGIFVHGLHAFVRDVYASFDGFPGL